MYIVKPSAGIRILAVIIVGGRLVGWAEEMSLESWRWDC